MRLLYARKSFIMAVLESHILLATAQYERIGKIKR